MGDFKANLINIDDQINKYVEAHNPMVYILTPCYGSMCYVNYVHSLMRTKEMFDYYKIRLKIEFCKNDSLVSRARNNLIAKAMADKQATHFMFIDNDITWDPINIVKLLISEKPVAGGIYPLKKYNWDKLTNNNNFIKDTIEKKNKSYLKDFVDDSTFMQYNMLKYNVNYLDKEIKIEKNLTEVKHIATGFMLIKRGVIEKMIEAYPSTKYIDDVGFLSNEENNYAYALFDCGVENEHYLSEDWMFCSRWSKIGGKLWIDVSINLSHTGIEDFHGSLLSTLL
jgi:hypothetical protein